MTESSKTVNGFRFMPPSLGAWIGKDIPESEFDGAIPWTGLEKPVTQTRFALMTSAGISMKTDEPFNMERERQEPAWGDPTHREIPVTAKEKDIDINHLHINTDYTRQDINVMLPIHRFREFEEDGQIGSLAPTSYSYYGFQLDPRILLTETMPRVAANMKKEGVEAAFLTPA